jgi:hypothetical protein
MGVSQRSTRHPSYITCSPFSLEDAVFHG